MTERKFIFAVSPHQHPVKCQNWTCC